jgi:hypothetical protein
METTLMTTSPTAPKGRPNLPTATKSAMTGAKNCTKGHDVNALVDAMWNGTVFGPYLVPLSRRVD